VTVSDLYSELRAAVNVAGRQAAIHMFLDDRLGHIQADSGSLPLLLGAEIGVEYPYEHVFVDPAAVIPYRYHSPLFFVENPDTDARIVDGALGEDILGVLRMLSNTWENSLS